MSTQSRIDEAVERNRDELTKELLWIRINEGLTHLPWDELGEVEKQRIENTFNILITAMEQSYEVGRAQMTLKQFDDLLDDLES